MFDKSSGFGESLDGNKIKNSKYSIIKQEKRLRLLRVALALLRATISLLCWLQSVVVVAFRCVQVLSKYVGKLK